MIRFTVTVNLVFCSEHAPLNLSSVKERSAQALPDSPFLHISKVDGKLASLGRDLKPAWCFVRCTMYCNWIAMLGQQFPVNFFDFHIHVTGASKALDIIFFISPVTGKNESPFGFSNNAGYFFLCHGFAQKILAGFFLSFASQNISII